MKQIAVFSLFLSLVFMAPAYADSSINKSFKEKTLSCLRLVTAEVHALRRMVKRVKPQEAKSALDQYYIHHVRGILTLGDFLKGEERLRALFEAKNDKELRQVALTLYLEYLKKDDYQNYDDLEVRLSQKVHVTSAEPLARQFHKRVQARLSDMLLSSAFEGPFPAHLIRDPDVAVRERLMSIQGDKIQAHRMQFLSRPKPPHPDDFVSEVAYKVHQEAYQKSNPKVDEEAFFQRHKDNRNVYFFELAMVMLRHDLLDVLESTINDLYSPEEISPPPSFIGLMKEVFSDLPQRDISQNMKKVMILYKLHLSYPEIPLSHLKLLVPLNLSSDGKRFLGKYTAEGRSPQQTYTIAVRHAPHPDKPTYIPEVSIYFSHSTSNPDWNNLVDRWINKEAQPSSQAGFYSVIGTVDKHATQYSNLKLPGAGETVVESSSNQGDYGGTFSVSFSQGEAHELFIALISFLKFVEENDSYISSKAPELITVLRSLEP